MNINRLRINGKVTNDNCNDLTQYELQAGCRFNSTEVRCQCRIQLVFLEQADPVRRRPYFSETIVSAPVLEK